MKIIGCDFHPSYQQIAVLDLATGETRGEGAESREKGGGTGLLCGTGRVRTSGDRGQRTVAVVRRECWRSWDTRCGSGCGEDPRQLRAEAED